MTKPITTEEFDRLFDAEEDITPYIDMTSLGMNPPLDTSPKRVNVDFPEWIVDSLDREANRYGISRQALIKVWVTERLDQELAKA